MIQKVDDRAQFLFTKHTGKHLEGRNEEVLQRRLTQASNNELVM